MPEIELAVSAVKCPICDFNHNYKVKIEYEESETNGNDSTPKYYNKFVTQIKQGDKLTDVPVFEIDSFCSRNHQPYRMIVEPKIPATSNPMKFTVTVVP